MNNLEQTISKNKSQIPSGVIFFFSVNCSVLGISDVGFDKEKLVSGDQKNSPEILQEAGKGSSPTGFQAKSIDLTLFGGILCNTLWHKLFAKAASSIAPNHKTTKKTQIRTSVHLILRSCRPAAGKPSQVPNQAVGAVIARKTPTPAVPLMDALKPRRWLDHQILSIPISAGKFEKLPSSNSFRHA